MAEALPVPAERTLGPLPSVGAPLVNPPLVNPPAASENQDEEESSSVGGTADTADDQQQGKQALVPHHRRHLSVADEHEINEEDENAAFTEPEVDESFDYEDS